MKLQANQSVWVWVLAKGDGGQVGAGVVTNVAADRVGIQFPELREPLPGCEPDSVVVLRTLSEQGTHVAETSVLRVQSAPQVLISVRSPQSFKTLQRRKFFRVATRLSVVCTIAASARSEVVGRTDVSGKTQNISAGGISMLTTLDLQIGDEVALRVSIPSLRGAATVLNLSGKVLRVGPGERKPRVTSSVGIQFAHKDQREEDTLVRLMFELQRKSLI